MSECNDCRFLMRECADCQRVRLEEQVRTLEGIISRAEDVAAMHALRQRDAALARADRYRRGRDEMKRAFLELWEAHQRGTVQSWEYWAGRYPLLRREE